MSKYLNMKAAMIIGAATMIAVFSVWRDSPIVDEIPHIGAGYGYIFEQSYQFNPEHPPLAKDLAGIGLKLAGLDQTAAHNAFVSRSAGVNDQWNFGRQLLYGIGNDAVRLIRAAKLSVMFLFIISAALIFIWTRKLYGGKAALISVYLFSFSPTVIAHTRFVTTDIAALFGVLLASYFFLKYRTQPSRKYFWFSVIALGIAFLCKFSTFLLVPFFLLLAMLWPFARRRPIWPYLGRTVLIIALAFIVVVGPYYQLHLINYPAAKQKTDTAFLLASYGNKDLSGPVIAAAGVPVLRPFAEYALGLLMVNQRIEGGNRIYFLGKVVNKGGPWYFPIVYTLKEPIPFFILLLMAIMSGLALLIRGRLGSFRHAIATHFPQTAMFLWLLIYWMLSISSTVNIGIRHMIPVYGFTAILVAGQIIGLIERSKLKNQNDNSKFKMFGIQKFYILIFALLTWYAVEFASIYPYYLTYFNQFAGGVSGGREYVTDSNLDWGQDLWRLADWVKENNIKKISLDYFGWADQRYYIGPAFNWMVGGQYTSKGSFLRDNPQGGYIAVSETFYQQSIHSDGSYLWLKDIPPLTVIGHSILVWYISP